ncbi:hypothetical protein ARTHRO9V_210239 [Arthrobacter sp. 9V]|nr:hypothetical protein ARTHRO9V_210239 [Arthrobacter sp. 9V]
MSCVIARETGDERGASLAQSVERFTRNEKVISSILIGSSEKKPRWLVEPAGLFVCRSPRKSRPCLMMEISNICPSH